MTANPTSYSEWEKQLPTSGVAVRIDEDGLVVIYDLYGLDSSDPPPVDADMRLLPDEAYELGVRLLATLERITAGPGVIDERDRDE